MLSPLYGQLSPLRVPTKVREVADTDALAYIAAVQAADGQNLEDSVKFAYEDFILGCKSDGIWTAIKASCILAGARTLSGALVPLVGTAPTNSNFVTADYNRKSGLKGNGTTKYLNSNRNNNADPQNNYHASIYRGEEITVTHAASFLGAGASGVAGRSTLQNNYLSQFTNGYFVRARSSAGPLAAASSQNAAGFLAVSRASASTISYSAPGNQSGTLSVTSEAPHNGNIWIFAVNNSGSIFSPTDNRLSFYSVGESLDLAKFGTQVRTLMTSLAAAIP
jgi:hypothetical protein